MLESEFLAKYGFPGTPVGDRMAEDLQAVEGALYGRLRALQEDWKSLPVWGPDDRGYLILDGVDRDHILEGLEAAITGIPRPKPSRGARPSLKY